MIRHHLEHGRRVLMNSFARLSVLIFGLTLLGPVQAGLIFQPGPTVPTLDEFGDTSAGILADGGVITNEVLYQNGGETVRMVGDATAAMTKIGNFYRIVMEAGGIDVGGGGTDQVRLAWDFEVQVSNGNPTYDIALLAGIDEAGMFGGSSVFNEIIASGLTGTNTIMGTAPALLDSFVDSTAYLLLSVNLTSFSPDDEIFINLPTSGGLSLTSVAAVPAPSTLLLLAFGGLLAARRLTSRPGCRD